MTITRSDIIEAASRETGLARTDTEKLVNEVLAEIVRALAVGESVKIMNFGSFYVRHKPGRIGRNPKTGEEIPIPPRRIISFKASKGLKVRVALNVPDPSS